MKFHITSTDFSVFFLVAGFSNINPISQIFRHLETIEAPFSK